MKLEWNSIAEETFKIEIYPYFKAFCSVYGCLKCADYRCHYILSRKEFSKVQCDYIYPEGSQVEFYLCENHRKSEYLKLEYSSSSYFMKRT